MNLSNVHLVSVAVAGVWAGPGAPRPLDSPALAAPVRLQEWLASLDDELRLELCTRKLLDTQVLFGEQVIVVDAQGDWYRVVVPGQPSSKDPRGYPGWIPSSQLIPAGDIQPAHGRFALVTAPTAALRSPDRAFESLHISFTTRLPLLAEHGNELEVLTPLGHGRLERAAVDIDAGQPRPRSAPEIIAMGEAFIGLPYLWSGRSGFGFDCSGFVHALFKAGGYLIARDAIDQAQAGTPVALDALEPGDLLFFERPQNDGRLRIEHVGLYCGDGQMLHSPTSGQSIEYCRLAGSRYERELCAARRYVTDDKAVRCLPG